MAGLNFYTQTIINSNVDPDSKVKEPLFKGITAEEEGDKCLRIKRDFTFYKEKANYGRVLSVTKAVGTKPEMAQAELKISGNLEKELTARMTGDGAPIRLFCRLDMYIGMEGAEPFIYSTPWVQKGMPFWVEFTVKKGASAKAISEELVKAIKSNHLFQCDKDLIEVKVNEGNTGIIFYATSEFQRFRKMTVSVFNEYQDDADVIAELYPVAKAEGHESDAIKLNVYGKAGFGTYSHIIKDLRLPTAANWLPNHIRQVETPIIDAMYDEYIIEYCAPATNEGLGAVGQSLESKTTHVFWVKHEVASTFESALTTAGLTTTYVAPTLQERVDAAVAAKATSVSETGKKGI